MARCYLQKAQERSATGVIHVETRAANTKRFVLCGGCSSISAPCCRIRATESCVPSLGSRLLPECYRMDFYSHAAAWSSQQRLSGGRGTCFAIFSDVHSCTNIVNILALFWIRWAVLDFTSNHRDRPRSPRMLNRVHEQ